MLGFRNNTGLYFELEPNCWHDESLRLLDEFCDLCDVAQTVFSFLQSVHWRRELEETFRMGGRESGYDRGVYTSGGEQDSAAEIVSNLRHTDESLLSSCTLWPPRRRISR